jgi:glyoxylase-like metal-dependent hydrolase (beta-lactamase superfamily II)
MGDVRLAGDAGVATVTEQLDLLHLGHPKVLGTWLVEGDEPLLVDCGPASCLGELHAALERRGLGVRDLRHLLLTHIHLDHAGAAGSLVRENPLLRVHVSEAGAPHVVDPSRLERSARRLYGETFDPLWGELAPVPQENVDVLGERVLGFDVLPGRGHASHHVVFASDAGDVFTGDAAGVRIEPATYIAPVAPPPDVDLEAWEETLRRIEERAPARLRLGHYGTVEETGAHLERMRQNLATWAQRVRDGLTVEEFELAGEHDLEDESDPGTAESYRRAAPFWHSWQGLRRYWDTRASE